jgi:hypothetical protein
MGKIVLRKNRNNMTLQLIYLAIILKVKKIFAYISKYSSIKKYQICTEGIFHTVLCVLP